MSKLFKVSDEMPSWLRQACEFVGKKKEVVAEAVSLESLPTVEWKDETFHVKFNNNGAILYNKFKNEVRNIDHATTVEEVQQILDKDVVAEVEDDNVVTANQEDQVANSIEDEQPMIIEDDKEFNDELVKLANEEEKIDVEKQVVAEDITEEITDNDVPKTSINTVQEEFVSLKDYNHIVARVNQLERELKKMVKVAKKMDKLSLAFSEAQRAYNPEVINVDNGAQELEVQHYQEMEKATQQVIDAEHALDLSNMNDRKKLNEDFLKTINTGTDVKEEVNTPVEENINEDAIEILEDNDCEQNIECCEECNCDETCEENCSCCCHEVTDETMIDNFNNQICPCCQQQASLKGLTKQASLLGLQCVNCQSEFAYDLNTNKLFIKGE